MQRPDDLASRAGLEVSSSLDGILPWLKLSRGFVEIHGMVPRRLIVFLLVLAMGWLQAPVPRAQAVGQTLYVAPWGHDFADDGWSTPPNSFDSPWGTISMTIRRAEPGDVIVVRAGTYVENAGWGAVPGRSDAPITLQPYQDEKVILQGTLQLKGADYWVVRGIHFVDDPSQPRVESVVKFIGGTGWQLLDSEISGTRGVSNLMINADPQYGDPTNYLVAGNCIHDNLSTDTAPMTNHNVYLMPGYESGPGVLERNILFGAPNGANIKAAGPDSSTGASDVRIAFNTMSSAGAGVIIGYDSNQIVMERNLFGPQVGGNDSYNAAILGNHVFGVGNHAEANGVFGYPVSLRNTYDSTAPITASDTEWVGAGFNSETCSGFVPNDADAIKYGRYATATNGAFVDDDTSVFEADIEWIAEFGITKGCNPPINDRYCPDATVSRGAMAAFLRRALELPASSQDFFTDDDGSTFEDDINAIAAAGITKGCNPPANTRYCPSGAVSRGAMSAFLRRAFDMPASSVDFFTDDNGSVFESDINALAASGVTRGCDPPANTSYCPFAAVSRGAMAAFLHRALDSAF